MVDIPITRRRVGIDANITASGGPTGNAFVSGQLSKLATNVRDSYVEYANDIAYLEGQKVISQEVRRIEQENAANPALVEQSINKYRDAFIAKVGNKEIAARFDSQIASLKERAISRTTSRHRQLLDDKATFASLSSLDELQKDIKSLSVDLLSDDALIADSAARQLQNLLLRGQNILGQSDASGMPLFNANSRLSKLEKLKDAAVESSVLSWIDRQEDKQAALAEFMEGSLRLELPNENDGVDNIVLRDAVGQQMLSSIERQARSQIAAREAETKKERSLQISNMELLIATARDDDVSSKGEKLSALLQGLDDNPLFADVEGQIKANNLRKKIFNELDAEFEKQESIALGSVFANGETFVNGADSKQVDAFNDYYQSIETSLAQMPPEERNIFIASMVSNARHLPTKLKGNIQAIARGQDVDQIAQVADLLDRVSGQNPHLMPMFGSNEDVARINMMNERLNRGYDAEDAIRQVDALLDPKNQVTIVQANAELKQMNINYDEEMQELFDASIIPFRDGIDEDSPVQLKIFDRMAAAYRAEYEDHYRLTRNKDLAKKHADTMIKGRYGITNVNPDNAVMMFPPERYYGLPGSDNKWMRQQMIDSAHERLKNSFVSDVDMFSKDDLEDKVFLAIDPNVTPRSARTGSPKYKLMYMRDDGTLLPITNQGEHFIFSPDQERKRLIDEAQK
tara:strand:+ start:17923 stop:19983 length:2061 start_codon:yes stop_codon:yes gene_type:complete